jgi:uncharacterized membrane protein YkvA (DUF1232 family)
MYTIYMNEQLDRIELKLAELTGKVDAALASTEKMRKYAKWTAIVTVAVIVIPLLIIPFVLPSFFAAEGVGANSGSGSTDSLSSLGL